jgi:protein-S-isoprenylcysteine O-methyltransferase Ste14
LKVDPSSLFMVLAFSTNVIMCIINRDVLPIPRGIGEALYICGAILFAYALLYLGSGFLGDTKPNLKYLITKGPYGFCRHPLYLSYITMVLGMGLMFRSAMAVASTLILSIPSAIHRARIEDGYLRDKFGEEWSRYAERVGFLLPQSIEREGAKRLKSKSWKC